MNTDNIQKIIFDTINFEYNNTIETYEAEQLSVEFDGKTAKIGYDTISSLCRGYFLFARDFKKGSINLHQKAHFKTCGCMLDASRNGVMTVKGVKNYLNKMACLGLNMLMLYTEDTYEIEEEPLFGYMRGRYSTSELREIDSYAKLLGIEVIPCIQTLAHLEQFLKYKEKNYLRDNKEILLANSEKTYEFIENEIKAITKGLSSKRIHIGMDEAHDLGKGAYLDKFGLKNRFEILNNHLSRVEEICKRYNVKPMMWNDMYFRLSTGEYYNYKDISISQDIIDTIPNVDMVYWDYYHKDKAIYDGMLEATKKLNKPIVFAGGISIWYGFLPVYDYCVNNSIPAMQACLEHKIDTVFATMWGDDGTETNAELALPYLPIYSEYCYLGNECNLEEIKETSQFLTKFPFEITYAIGQYYGSKSLFYSDILFDLGMSIPDCKIKIETMTKSLDTINNYIKSSNENYDFCIYAKLLYEIAIEKAKLKIDLRNSYQNNDKNYLEEVKNTTLPLLKQKYISFKQIHKKIWHSNYKTFGFETLSCRYGAIISRIDDAIEKLNDYCEGTLDKIEELEEKIIDYDYNKNSAKSVMSVSVIK